MASLWNSWRITHRFIAMLAAFMVSILVVAGIGLSGMASARDDLRQLYEGAMMRSQMAEQIVQIQNDTRLQVLLAFQHAPGSELAEAHDHPIQVHLDAIATNQSTAIGVHKTLVEDSQTDEERALLDEATKARQAWRPKLAQALEAINRNDFSAQVMGDFLEAARNEGTQVHMTMEAFRAHQLIRASTLYNHAEERYALALWIFGGAALLLVLPSVLLALALLTRLKGGFMTASTALKQIADSDLSHPVPHSGTDEIGCMHAAHGGHALELVARGRQCQNRGGGHCQRLGPGGCGHAGPVLAHRAAGQRPGRNGCGHGRALQHRAAKRGQRSAGQ